ALQCIETRGKTDSAHACAHPGSIRRTLRLLRRIVSCRGVDARPRGAAPHRGRPVRGQPRDVLPQLQYGEGRGGRVALPRTTSGKARDVSLAGNGCLAASAAGDRRSGGATGAPERLDRRDEHTTETGLDEETPATHDDDRIC